MKKTVDFIVEQLDCLNRERKEKIIDAETYFKNKKALIEQAKEMDKQKQGYGEEEVLDLLYKRDLYLISKICSDLTKKWFEQFKK